MRCRCERERADAGGADWLRGEVEKLIALAKRLRAEGTVARVQRGGQVRDLAALSADQAIDAVTEAPDDTG